MPLLIRDAFWIYYETIPIKEWSAYGYIGSGIKPGGLTNIDSYSGVHGISWGIATSLHTLEMLCV